MTYNHMPIYEKIKLLFFIYLLKFRIIKMVIKAKTMQADEYKKQIFKNDTKSNGRCKIAIDPSGQPRFLMNNTIYRLNIEPSLFFDDSDEIPIPIIDLYNEIIKDGKAQE